MNQVQRFLSILLLALYVYNLAGYILVFLILRGDARHDVSEQIASGTTRASWITMTFPTTALLAGKTGVQWLELDEFRYDGTLYDVVSREERGDTTVIVCYADIKETQVYAAIDHHTSRQAGAQDVAHPLVQIKSAIGETTPVFSLHAAILPQSRLFPSASPDSYRSVILDISPPPPEQLLYV